ncbi:MAG: DUF2202 domain-containing protein [Flavobacteriales bacterium]|nr:DUF2202 domain-containing protein [Bacteroidota bacterium]MCB9241216.1 DUF2202 domain-containing protein [Flavobacteriales bacterium]
MKPVIITSALLALLAIQGCKEDTPPTPSNGITQDEINDLRFLREEEKLARDVYLFSYAKYGEQIFTNISASEQKHMDKVLELLNTYNIQDPASADTGVFNNPTLQNLYAVLTAKSDSSLLDALWVGATIEDLDIDDIESNIGRTNRSDLLDVYNSLQCGSRNHLRAYASQIKSNGSTYVPQYLSQSDYDDILAGSHESCGG